jgi:hypothetical protein
MGGSRQRRPPSARLSIAVESSDPVTLIVTTGVIPPTGLVGRDEPYNYRREASLVTPSAAGKHAGWVDTFIEANTRRRTADLLETRPAAARPYGPSDRCHVAVCLAGLVTERPAGRSR